MFIHVAVVGKVHLVLLFSVGICVEKIISVAEHSEQWNSQVLIVLKCFGNLHKEECQRYMDRLECGAPEYLVHLLEKYGEDKGDKGKKALYNACVQYCAKICWLLAKYSIESVGKVCRSILCILCV